MKDRLHAWGHDLTLPIGSALILDLNNELLLLKRHTEDIGGGKWAPPGGRVEPGEAASATVVREVYEETGLRLANTDLLGIHEISMPHGRINLASFLSRFDHRPRVVLDPDEHIGYGWFPLNEVARTRELVWGLPSVLLDFGLLPKLETDISLLDGSSIRLLNRGN